MARRSFARDWYEIDRRAWGRAEGPAGIAGIGALIILPFIAAGRLVLHLLRGRRRPDPPVL